MDEKRKRPTHVFHSYSVDAPRRHTARATENNLRQIVSDVVKERMLSPPTDDEEEDMYALSLSEIQDRLQVKDIDRVRRLLKRLIEQGHSVEKLKGKAGMYRFSPDFISIEEEPSPGILPIPIISKREREVEIVSVLPEPQHKHMRTEEPSIVWPENFTNSYFVEEINKQWRSQYRNVVQRVVDAGNDFLGGAGRVVLDLSCVKEEFLHQLERDMRDRGFVVHECEGRIEICLTNVGIKNI